MNETLNETLKTRCYADTCFLVSWSTVENDQFSTRARKAVTENIIVIETPQPSQDLMSSISTGVQGYY